MLIATTSEKLINSNALRHCIVCDVVSIRYSLRSGSSALRWSRLYAGDIQVMVGDHSPVVPRHLPLSLPVVLDVFRHRAALDVPLCM